MKPKAGFVITCFFSMLLLLNCKKEKTENNLPIQNPIGRKVKILEYGTQMPLANVKLTVKKCYASGKYGCSSYGDSKSWISGTDGIVNIPKNEYPTVDDLFTAEETDHWTKSEVAIFDTIIQKSSYDSAVIRLYAFASIDFHFKSVNSYGAKEWFRTYMEAWPDNIASFSIESPIFNLQPANNMDTMFNYKTYGNVKNRLVCELLDSNFAFIKKLYDETTFISKSAHQPWSVSY